MILGLIILDVTSESLDDSSLEFQLPIRSFLPKIISIIQFSGGFIICIGYIFQIYKIYKTKSVEDLSEIQLIAIFVACMLFEAYAVHNFLAMIEFFITNTISTFLSGVVLVQYWVYRVNLHEEKSFEMQEMTMNNMRNVQRRIPTPRFPKKMNV